MKPGRIAGIVLAATAAVVLIVLLARPGWYVKLFHPLRYPSYIRTHAANYDLPPDLVAAVIYQESRFNERATSSAGARGLMQLTPDTARGIAQRTGGHRFSATDLYDPEINIRYGSWYLNHLRDKYRARGSGGDPYALALAAYNAGQGRVDQWIREQPDGHLSVDEIPFRETRDYVRLVEGLQADYAAAWGPELGLHRGVAE